MTYTKLSEAQEKIENREDFDGNNIRGEWMLWLDGGCWVYVVRSYSTPILAIAANAAEGVLLNKTRYSTTTSRHQNIVQRALDEMSDLKYCTAREVYDLPRGDAKGFFAKIPQ